MIPFINWKKKKENILDKNLLTNNPYVGNGKNIPDINKRDFIKKGILGVMFGGGIAAFSKIANARYIFPDATSQSTVAGLTREGATPPRRRRRARRRSICCRPQG